ncbi:tyrosine-type recombinase/integrase [Mycolicibacterium vinylchloridicum]|uniref:tyrosine-type recombinase/integrase n=1 Tax=Mycolicibacterium vinylchloridicum TaxID=2736928 RepID=UPI0015CDE106|nr:site-specific integrase [Mycolicibacterium vinylchloridicum]
MASLRERKRKDGTIYWAVLYRHHNKQTSTSFDDFTKAERFCELATKFGVDNALATIADNVSVVSEITVEQWCLHHVDLLTGVDRNTANKYRAYIRNDIAPVLGTLPLVALTPELVKAWVNEMQEPDEDGKRPASKTVRNKLMFLAGALNTAVPKKIPENPASNIELRPDDDPQEMYFLTKTQFAHLLQEVTPHWRLLVQFLAVTGARWGEVTALRPSDVDRENNRVHIRRSWKHGADGYRLGTTKTTNSVRWIKVPKQLLDQLDYSGEYIFTNRTGGPVRSHGFIRRVWMPAVERAWPSVDDKGQPIQHNRQHPKPRIHDLRHSAASWLLQDRVPMAVVSKHLGHRDIRTTVNTYGHFDEHSMEAISDSMESMVTAV